jgi:hypothetical protein
MHMTTPWPKIASFLILLFLLILPGGSFPEGLFLSGTVTEGFKGLRWETSLEEALRAIPDLHFDRYALPASDKTPSKIYYRMNEDGKIGPVTFRRIEYWFRDDSFYKITACLGSHYGPRTLVTDAERDFKELCGELKFQYGEPVRERTGLGFTDFDRYASWRVGRTIVSLSYKETGENTSESCLEIKSQ